jgi:hypothetical protein
VIADGGATFVRTGGLVPRVNARTGTIEWGRSGPGFLGRPGIDALGVAPYGFWLSGSPTERMDPATGEIVETLPIASAAVAFDRGELWLLELDGSVAKLHWS